MTRIEFCSSTPDWRWLSNFSNHRVGKYTTAEHAYQAMKTRDAAERDWIAAAPYAAEAKKRGQKVTVRPDWEQTKRDWMRKVLGRKLADNPILQQKLQETGDAELVHITPNFTDKYWGYPGRNELGKLWMELRDELRASES